MKDQVLNFLGDLPQAGSNQFNQALELYRKTKGHDSGKVRFYNNLGFSKDRLDGLLYDLKKSNGVTDVEAANAARSKKAIVKKVEDEDTPTLESVKAIVSEMDVESASEEEIIATAKDMETVLEFEPSNGDVSYYKELILAFKKDLMGEASKKSDGNNPAQVGDEGTSETSENGSEDPGNDTEKETLEITSEELGTKELSEKLEEHISVNQIDVNEEKDVSTSLDVTDPFLQKLADFNLEEEKYNSIKSFAAEVSDFIGEDPKDQKGETLKAFVAEAKKKLV